jgi:hypothetical protein
MERNGAVQTAEQLAALPEAEREQKLAADKKFNADYVLWAEECIKLYVTVPEGYLVDRGTPITTGEGLIDMFYARRSVLAELVAQIYLQNRLDGTILKNLRSSLGSATGSPVSTPTSDEAIGGEQASTATNAEPKKASVSEEPATESPVESPSGSTPAVH